MPAPESLQDKIEELTRRLERLDSAHRKVLEENQALRRQQAKDAATIQELRRRLDHFIRTYLGSGKSETVSRDQLELALQGLADLLREPEKPAMAPAVSTPPPDSTPRARRPRQALDDSRLPTVETVLEPEEVKADPQGWRLVSEQRTTQLDYEPGRLYRHVIRRPCYVRKEEFVIAPLPAQPIDKGMVGPGLLAWLLMSKYTDHIPLHRLMVMLRRQHGIEIPRNTMVSWVEQSAALLIAVYRAMQAKLRKKGYLQVDETPVRYLEQGAKGRSKRGYMWVYLAPAGEVIFQWSTGRAAAAPEVFLGPDFRGTIQCDGYSAYTALRNQNPVRVELAHCWAHARRAIYEASPEAPRTAAWLLGQIQAMYAIEKPLREARAGPALRAAIRSGQTAMVVERMFKAMKRLRSRCLSGGAMARALDYAIEREAGLKRFLSDGRLEIDTNLVENAIRPCALGRRNWLFIGHEDAGERAALFYTLVASCRVHGINPMEYLRDVLTRLPSAKNSEIDHFTPEAWAKARRNSAR